MSENIEVLIDKHHKETILYLEENGFYEIEELPADDVFFDYIEKGTEPTIEVKDILDIE
jgi:hypothetical protein